MDNHNSENQIQATLAGRADLDVSDVLKEAWQRCEGARLPLLLMFGILFLITVCLNLLFQAVGLDEEKALSSLFIQLANTAVVNPFIAGVLLLAFGHLQGRSIDIKEAFNVYPMLVPILLLSVLQSLITGIGFLLLIVPGIYLSIALSLSLPLLVEKNYGITDALKTSLNLVNKEFLSVLVLAFLSVLLIVIGFMTLVGWIITLPYVVMIYAITYRQLAGFDLQEPSALENPL
ncbi:MAG: YciC family protein [bacterium]